MSAVVEFLGGKAYCSIFRAPVIAATHNACIGAGLDMITAADIRICSSDAVFCVKEVDVGLAADGLEPSM